MKRYSTVIGTSIYLGVFAFAASTTLAGDGEANSKPVVRVTYTSARAKAPGVRASLGR